MQRLFFALCKFNLWIKNNGQTYEESDFPYEQEIEGLKKPMAIV